MWLTRDQVVAAVVLLDAFHLPASSSLVGYHLLYCDALDLLVTYHRGNAGLVPVRVRKHPCPPVMLDIGNCTVLLLFQFLQTTLQPVIQFVQPLLGQANVGGQRLAGVSSLL